MSSWLADTYRDKSVFITGHTGFKGSWMCHWLHRLGAHVSGFALDPPTAPNNFTVSNIRDKLARHTIGDVRDQEALTRAIEESAPDVIFHLAAQSIVREGYIEPRETFDVNVMGTVTMLEAVRKLGRPCTVVSITSDKCYDNREQIWGYREIDAFGDHDPYGGSKGAAEIAIRAYRDSFFPIDQIEQHGVKLASARAGNVIGGGDWTADALMVDIFKALSADKPVSIRSPHSLRPWQHVLQALSGYMTIGAKLLACDDPELCSGWNIGPLPGNELPVHQIVDLFIQQWGSGSWVDDSDAAHPREANILRLNIDKAIWKLGWKPCWSVYESVQQTARWYRAYLDNPASAEQYGEHQMELYEAAFERGMDPIVLAPGGHAGENISRESFV